MTTARLRPLSSLLFASALLLTQAPAARGKEAEKRGDRLITPAVELTAKDVKKLLHTGVGVAAKLARVAGVASMVVVGSEALIVAGDAAEAGIDAGTNVVESNLVMVISRNKRVLETLKKEGRLKRGNREFDTIMAELEEEQKALSFKSGGDFFKRAVTSREGLHAMGKVPLKHGVVGLIGDRVSKWLGLGGRVRGLRMDSLARSRTATRPTWERADGISRFMARVIDRLTNLAAKEAAKEAIGEDIADYVPGLSDANSSVPTEQRPYLPMPEPAVAARAIEPQLELRALSPAMPAPARAAPVAVEPLARMAPAPLTAERAAPVEPNLSRPAPVPPLPPSEVTGDDRGQSRERDDSGSRSRQRREPRNSETLRQLERIDRTGNWPKP